MPGALTMSTRAIQRPPRSTSCRCGSLQGMVTPWKLARFGSVTEWWLVATLSPDAGAVPGFDVDGIGQPSFCS